MEVTPKLHRKSLSLTSRLRNRSSATPSPKNRLRNAIVPSSPISILSDGGVEGTPPHRSFSFNPPYSPPNDTDFSPRSRLSQSSNNSPDVTWRWTQDDQPTNNSPNMSKSKSSSSNANELRKKRSEKRKEELRKAELEKRKAIKTRRDDVIKKQCEQMELIIAKKYTATKTEESDFVENKQLSPKSSGFGSKEKEVDLFDDSAFDELLEAALDRASSKKKQQSPSKTAPIAKEVVEKVGKLRSPIRLPVKDTDIDLLNDSESDGFLLEASQQVEISIEKEKKSCTKELERSFDEVLVDKEKSSNYDFLQDSFDDCFALVDDDALAVESKKARASLQRYKSMPTDSPKTTTTSTALGPSPSTSKIRRYPSSTALRPKKINILALMKSKLKANRQLLRTRNVGFFKI